MLKKMILVSSLILLSLPNTSYAPDECEEMMNNTGLACCAIFGTCCMLLAGQNVAPIQQHNEFAKNIQNPIPSEMGNQDTINKKNN